MGHCLRYSKYNFASQLQLKRAILRQTKNIVLARASLRSYLCRLFTTGNCRFGFLPLSQKINAASQGREQRRLYYVAIVYCLMKAEFFQIFYRLPIYRYSYLPT